MNNLKLVRLKAHYRQSDACRFLSRIDNRVDIPLFSKMEQGVCMPTAEQFRTLCKIYGVEPNEVYSRDEVDYGVSRNAKRLREARKGYRNICGSVPIELAGNIEEMVKVCGYTNITGWINACVKKLAYEYQKRKQPKDMVEYANRLFGYGK